MKRTITRRRLLEESLLAAAAAGTLASAPALARPRARRRDPLRIAVIGLRGRGRAHVKAFRDSPDSEVVALCDVDEAVVGPALQAVPKARVYTDLRELLRDESIDAVSIATPNHWHALGSVLALDAGKHVYVEKPLSHTFAEGRALADAARKSGKLVQHGTQARSHKATRDAIEWLHAGALGEVRLARGLCYKRRASIGLVDGPQQPPFSCDYDLWTGPAAFVPLRRKSLHYDWHWDFNTGNGDIGNQGVHQMDLARWGLGQARLPRAVTSVGGRVGYEDDGNTPNSQIALYDYGPQTLVFEVRGLPTKARRVPGAGATIGTIFECEQGYLVIASYDRTVAYDRKGQELRVFEGGGDHFQNFLDAVHAGDPGILNADAEEGHLSAALCHLGHVPYHLGSDCALPDVASRLGAGWVGAESWESMRAHLVEAGLDARSTRLRVGPDLAFDPALERFTGDHAERANALLERDARPPFTMPSV